MASFKKWRDRRQNPWKGVFYDAFRLWKGERGQTRLYDYMSLPIGAVVFDFGGYKGEWADMVLNQQPDCTIHVFEPHPDFAANLFEKYAEDDRVTVHGYALGSEDGKLSLSDAENASSAVANHEQGISAQVISVERFFSEHNIARIDLVKMNIAGSEYDLVPALIDTGIMERIARIQIQFHLFDEGMIDMREAIRAEMEDTHECSWSYPFVWEEWRRSALEAPAEPMV